MNKIAILGSTGSIGRQTLEVIEAHPDSMEAYALVANNNVDMLIEQARRFNPEIVVIANDAHYTTVKDALADMPVKVFAGADAPCQIAGMDVIDTVVASMVGYAGLASTIAAIKAGKRIALANKETLVVAGDLITRLVQKHHAAILPVDSEHGAIFQCLVGERDQDVDRIYLTASGGPFRTFDAERLRRVTAADALQHPTWQMGAKITIDSATLMNKGFEVIEARWLFGLKPEQIEVVVHPQSVVHSMVQYTDGSIKAQLGVPDMRLPIQYALTYPERKPCPVEKLDFFTMSDLTFERPDLDRFPCLGIAYDALRQGGNIPCAVNAANEIAVAAFLSDRISFPNISRTIEYVAGHTPFVAHPTHDDYVACDGASRQLASEYIKSL